MSQTQNSRYLQGIDFSASRGCRKAASELLTGFAAKPYDFFAAFAAGAEAAAESPDLAVAVELLLSLLAALR